MTTLHFPPGFQWGTATASYQITVSTGRSSPLKYEGLVPIKFLYCLCVTSLSAIQKSVVSVTG